MSWKLVLALGIVFAKPAIRAIQAVGAERACKQAYYRENEGCGVTAEELDDVARKSEADIQKFFEDKGMTPTQKEAALRYIDNHWYAKSKSFQLEDEVQTIKDWNKKMTALRKKQESS